MPFILDTDASETGLGAVLSQVIDGTEKPIAFASRRLQPAERKWPIREKEALAIVWGLQHYQHFLLGSKFTIRSDHSSLTVLQGAKKGRLARWAIQLAEFGDLNIGHRPGSKHSNVDAFTRLPESDTVPAHATCTFTHASSPSWTLAELKTAQDDDAWCQQELSAFHQGQRSNYTIADGILNLRHSSGLRVLLPERLRQQVIRHAHDLCHFGTRRTLSVLRERYLWPKMMESVKIIVSQCLACLRRKTPQPRSGLMASSPPTDPWHVVAMDFCGPYKRSQDGSRYVLVFVDQFTKMVELCATKDQLADTVAHLFYERILCRYGAPRFLLSDRGPQMRSLLVQQLCTTFGVQKIFSSAYYPQGDGYAERFMRTLNNSLSILTSTTTSTWDKYLPSIAFGYNVTEHAATGHSPFFVNFGRIPRLVGKGERPSQNIDNIQTLHHNIIQAQSNARHAVHAYWAKMKEVFDRRRKDVKIEVGSSVLVRLSDHERSLFPCRKLAPRWSSPALIVDVRSNGVTCGVKRPGKPVESVHCTRLLPLNFNVPDHLPPRNAPPPSSSPSAPPKFPSWPESDSDDEFEMLPSQPKSLVTASSLPQSSAAASSASSSLRLATAHMSPSASLDGRSRPPDSPLFDSSDVQVEMTFGQIVADSEVNSS